MSVRLSVVGDVRPALRETEGQTLCLTGTKSIHEFDFIVEFKDRFYIFETKTGSLGVERWIEHARMFNDREGPNRFLMCTAMNDLPGKIFLPYRLFHLDTLAVEFAEYVRREFGLAGA